MDEVINSKPKVYKQYILKHSYFRGGGGRSPLKKDMKNDQIVIARVCTRFL